MTRPRLLLAYVFLIATIITFSKSQPAEHEDEEFSGSSGYPSGGIYPDEDRDYEATTRPPFTTPAVEPSQDPPPDNNSSVSDSTCVVPPYITEVDTVDTSFEEFEELVAEWRCFLVCALAENGIVTVDTTYETWPFLSLEDTNCRHSAVIHECTRGCNMRRDGQQCASNCGQSCLDDCRRSMACTTVDRLGQCNDCINPDVHDPWFVTAGCSRRETHELRCSTKKCRNGCGISTNPLSPQEVPPHQPIAPPSLEQYYSSLDSQLEAGLYIVNLTSAMPTDNTTTNSTNTTVVSFVLRIEDVDLDNVQYRWQHSPVEVMSLAGHVCRNVSVSFAVVNEFGSSEFSPVTSLQVYGDSRQVPNGVTNIEVVEEIDTRPGYFGHARLFVSWERHSNGLHLESFQVIVSAPNKDVCGNDTFVQQVNATENVTSYSVTLEAESPTGIPFMGCTYHFTIYSVGPDGSTIELESTVIQKIDPPGVEFLCSRIWDSSTYFAFNFTWIMPLYLVHGHIMENFLIISDIVDDRNRSVQTSLGFSLPGVKEFPIPDTNETVFNFVLSDSEEFYKPKLELDRFYSFEMFIDWNEDNLNYVPNSVRYKCLLSARSPPPSPIRNLTISDHLLVGSQQVSLTMNWLPPECPNGELSDYNVCVGPYVLDQESQELPNTPHSCRTIEPTLTRTDRLVLHFFKNDSSPCLYLQMRANNLFVSGNWSEPQIFSVDASGTCEATTTNTTVVTPVTSSSSANLKIVVPAVVCGIIAAVLLFGCIVCVCAYVRMLRRRKRLWRIGQAPCNDPMFTSGPRNPFLTSPTEAGPLLPTTDEWEISPSEVLMEDLLGEGAFGEVYKGVLKGPITNSTVRPWIRNAIGTPVAIKLLKLSARGSERQDFLSEIEMMKRVAEGQNANVVCLLACVTIQEPLCLIIEFVKFGDLLSYLRNNRKFYTGNQLEGDDNPYLELGNISPNDLISFAYQIASGMEYLSSLGIVHRDLASRNVLVDEGKVLKITDFGMSRTTETNEIYVQKSKGRVPLKWMAIESIVAREFTTSSDVWSYGVTLWEISTLGGFPYPTIHNEDLLPLLKQGYRMDKPDNCSPEIYDIMLGCWEGDPKKRPTFTELRAKFDNMLLAEKQGAYIDLQIDAEKPYYQMDFKMELNNEQGSQQLQNGNLLHVTPSLRRHSLASGGGNHTPCLSSEISPAHLSLSANTPHGSHPSMQGASPIKESAGRNQTTELLPNGSNDDNDGSRRPVSLLLPGRERPAVSDSESRYVAEPSRLTAALNPMFAVRLNDHSSQINSTRRQSDGGLVLSMNGVPSTGGHEGTNGDVIQQPEITVTEDTL